MIPFEEINRRIFNRSGISPLSESEVDTIRREFAGIPLDYTDFLRLIGYGEVGDIRLYEAPIAPTDIYPAPEGDLSDIVLFGDDFQGYCFGFDTHRQFALVEVDPRGNPRYRTENSFLSLIASYITN